MSWYRRQKIQGGMFFFTLALADRQAGLLVDRIDLFRRSYRLIRRKWPFETVAICVLPDHVHAIWTLPEGDADYATRWRLIKNGFSRGCGVGQQRASLIKKGEKGIWQRRYWEHEIRNERDLRHHIDYIHYNPVKHGYVKQVVDWPYSSFHHYVATGRLPLDWGGGVDWAGVFGE